MKEQISIIISRRNLMHIISTVFLGLAANLDNFGVGVSYGVQKIRIPFLSNFSIALLSGVVTFISVLSGHLLSQFMTEANLNCPNY